VKCSNIRIHVLNLSSLIIDWKKALMKEGPLEDYLSISWQIPGEARTMVPGQFLKYCNDPNFDYGP
jgi:hypothetical protein